MVSITNNYLKKVIKDSSFEERIKQIIVRIIYDYEYELQRFHIVFTDDKNLLEINQKYLSHDTYTDVITFNYSEVSKSVETEVFISVDRVVENAKKFDVDFDNELMRVIIHSVLHSVDFKDYTVEERKNMQKLEDKYLKLFFVEN